MSLYLKRRSTSTEATRTSPELARIEIALCSVAWGVAWGSTKPFRRRTRANALEVEHNATNEFDLPLNVLYEESTRKPFKTQIRSSITREDGSMPAQSELAMKQR